LGLRGALRAMSERRARLARSHAKKPRVMRVAGYPQAGATGNGDSAGNGGGHPAGPGGALEAAALEREEELAEHAQMNLGLPCLGPALKARSRAAGRNARGSTGAAGDAFPS